MNFLPTRKIMALLGCRSSYANNKKKYKFDVAMNSTAETSAAIRGAPRMSLQDRHSQDSDKLDVLSKKEEHGGKIGYFVEGLITRQPSTLPLCVLNHTQLGKISIKNTRVPILSDTQYPMVKKGGYYKPLECVSRHQVGILVPYRDRQRNLAVFLSNIHPFLINQKLEYRIFVVEQFGKDLFNKGRLYNAAYKEMFQFGNWKCIVFHDVDLLPLDTRILYTCPICPRHMCATVREKKHSRNYHALFGGVTSMTPAHYQKANGYSNLYWGWGGEDNDMFWRLRAARLNVVRYNKSIAEYTALPHAVRHKNRFRFELLHTAMERAQDEGLSTVEYKVVAVTTHHLYTHLLIDVNPYKDNITLFVRNYH